jgi:hypothetical protein
MQNINLNILDQTTKKSDSDFENFKVKLKALRWAGNIITGPTTFRALTSFD